MGRVWFHCRAGDSGEPQKPEEGLNCRAERKGRGPKGSAQTSLQTSSSALQAPSGPPHRDLQLPHTIPAPCSTFVTMGTTSHPTAPESVHGQRLRAAARTAPAPLRAGTRGGLKHEFLASRAIVWPGKGAAGRGAGMPWVRSPPARGSRLPRTGTLSAASAPLSEGGFQQGVLRHCRQNLFLFPRLWKGVALCPSKTGGILFLLLGSLQREPPRRAQLPPGHTTATSHLWPRGPVTPFGGKDPFCGQTILFFVQSFINIVVIMAIPSVNCDSNSESLPSVFPPLRKGGGWRGLNFPAEF